MMQTRYLPPSIRVSAIVSRWNVDKDSLTKIFSIRSEFLLFVARLLFDCTIDGARSKYRSSTVRSHLWSIDSGLPSFFSHRQWKNRKKTKKKNKRTTVPSCDCPAVSLIVREINNWSHQRTKRKKNKQRKRRRQRERESAIVSRARTAKINFKKKKWENKRITRGGTIKAGAVPLCHWSMAGRCHRLGDRRRLVPSTWFAEVSSGFAGFRQGFTRAHHVINEILLSFIGFLWIEIGWKGLKRVSMGFNWVCPGFTWVEFGWIGFKWVYLGSESFQWVSMG